MKPTSINKRDGKIPRLISIGIFVAGVTSLVSLGAMIFKAFEMVLSGRGLETYRTFWLVEFNWLGFLIFLATAIVALVIASVMRFHENMLWRSLEKKYGSRNDHAEYRNQGRFFRLLSRSPMPCTLKLKMDSDRWFSILIAIFGCIFLFRALIIVSALAPIPPASWPPSDLVAEAESAQRFLTIIFAINLVFSVATFVSAIGIFFHKNWAVGLWIGTCVALLLTISVEMLALNLGWPEYLGEFSIAIGSLLYYRRRIASWILLKRGE